jgi:hypothetical protein
MVSGTLAAKDSWQYVNIVSPVAHLEERLMTEENDILVYLIFVGWHCLL